MLRVMIIRRVIAVVTLLTSLYHTPSIEAAVVFSGNSGGPSASSGENMSGATSGNVGNGDVTVTFRAPAPQNSSRQIGGPELQIDLRSMTAQDWMPILCHGLPSNVRDCQGVPSVNSYLGNRIAVGKRQRRDHWSNSPFFSPFNFDSWYSSFPNNFGSGPSYTFGPTAGVAANPTASLAVICPSQTNQSALYQLNPSSLDYPAVAIAEEIFANPALGASLAREIVLETTGPNVIYDAFLANAIPSCSSSTRRLWQYQSLQQGTMCWVMQNFGDLLTYTQCIGKFCQNWTNSSRQTAWRGAYWGSRTSSSNPYLYQNLCITEYRAVSLWAYCPLNLAGSQIVRDRIIIPVFCNCQRVLCEPASP